MKNIIILLVCLFAFSVQAADVNFNTVPEDQRIRMKNPDGSCVQCSAAIAGIHHHVPAAEFLLWDSEYGKAVRGGSWPGRVQEYCKERKIPIYNVEGSETIPYIEWALSTGRYAAVTYGRAHMITAVGISKDKQTFYVCDNNTPQRIDAVDRNTFISQHRNYGGGWCVIIQGPVPPPWIAPKFDRWWEK